MLQPKISSFKNMGNKKWGPSPATILQIYKRCVRPIFEYGIVSTITVSENVITKIQRFCLEIEVSIKVAYSWLFLVVLP